MSICYYPSRNTENERLVMEALLALLKNSGTDDLIQRLQDALVEMQPETVNG